MIRLSKTGFVGVLAFALLLSFAAAASADEVQGNIATIQHDDHVLTLVDDENTILEMRFLGGPVFVNDEQVTFWDLNPGDRVTIVFDREDYELLATDIRCMRGN